MVILGWGAGEVSGVKGLFMASRSRLDNAHELGRDDSSDRDGVVKFEVLVKRPRVSRGVRWQVEFASGMLQCINQTRKIFQDNLVR